MIISYKFVDYNVLIFTVQNSWYGGSGKAKEAQVDKNEEEKQIESEEIKDTATDSSQDCIYKRLYLVIYTIF